MNEKVLDCKMETSPLDRIVEIRIRAGLIFILRHTLKSQRENQDSPHLAFLAGNTNSVRWKFCCEIYFFCTWPWVKSPVRSEKLAGKYYVSLQCTNKLNINQLLFFNKMLQSELSQFWAHEFNLIVINRGSIYCSTNWL